MRFEANAYPIPLSYTWFHPSGRQLMNDQLNKFVDQKKLSLINVQRRDLENNLSMYSNESHRTY